VQLTVSLLFKVEAQVVAQVLKNQNKTKKPPKLAAVAICHQGKKKKSK